MDFFGDYAQNDLTPYWQQEFLGASPWSDPTAYLSHSPILHVRNVHTPVMIVHGSEDGRVPPAQSRELFAALSELGVPVEFYIYPREGHGFTEPKHQVDFMQRQLAWFERWLGARDRVK
jgi:dipeptidyl aminopeptidase/acylaminoacyl peptidase